ncbi:hypothetical protein C8R47DRAFT_1082850 [Mycena vitilis]|nr:hypothetical protein C8R47DRAFT_1082850 [Mycena vitilis]
MLPQKIPGRNPQRNGSYHRYSFGVTFVTNGFETPTTAAITLSSSRRVALCGCRTTNPIAKALHLSGAPASGMNRASCTKKSGSSVRFPRGRGKPLEVPSKVHGGRGRGWAIVKPPKPLTLPGRSRAKPPGNPRVRPLEVQKEVAEVYLQGLKREAELSPEELARQQDMGRQTRRRWRAHYGNDVSSSPVKEESPCPTPRRPTAEDADHLIGNLYEPFGPLDSQTGDGTYVDHLIDSWMESASQEGGISQGPAVDAHSDQEPPVQLQHVEAQRDTALRERDLAACCCYRYRKAFRAATAQNTKLRKELEKWTQAAEGASLLTKMLLPHSSLSPQATEVKSE